MFIFICTFAIAMKPVLNLWSRRRCKWRKHEQNDQFCSEADTGTQPVHTWPRSKRRKHAEKGIQREKETVGWKRKDRNDIIKKAMEKDEALMTLWFLLTRKRRRQRTKQKVKKNRAMWVRDVYKQREEKGAYHNLAQELLRDRGLYFK